MRVNAYFAPRCFVCGTEVGSEVTNPSNHLLNSEVVLVGGGTNGGSLRNWNVQGRNSDGIREGNVRDRAAGGVWMRKFGGWSANEPGMGEVVRCADHGERHRHGKEGGDRRHGRLSVPAVLSPPNVQSAHGFMTDHLHSASVSSEKDVSLGRTCFLASTLLLWAEPEHLLRRAAGKASTNSVANWSRAGAMFPDISAL